MGSFVDKWSGDPDTRANSDAFSSFAAQKSKEIQPQFRSPIENSDPIDGSQEKYDQAFKALFTDNCIKLHMLEQENQ